MAARAKILNASAGSGKTYALAYKYICDVLGDAPEQGTFDPTAYRRIVAVTFTNKATTEMKSRILRQIQALASGGKSDYLADLARDLGLDEQELRRRAKIVRTAILHDYSRFTILTNDTFFQRILRAFVKELGIELGYSLELDTAPVLSKSADAIIEDIASNTELREWVMEMAQDRIEAGERWNIRDGILLLNSELFKEYTKEPIAQVTDKRQLKAAVFSYAKRVDRIVEELQAKAHTAMQAIADAGLTNSDFSYHFTDYFDKVSALGAVLPTTTILKHIDDAPEAWFTKSSKVADKAGIVGTLQPILAEICDRVEEVDRMRKSRDILLRNYRSFAILGDLYRKSVEICKEENTMLLSETKHIISEFITENDAPFIYEKVGNRFDRYMIDEFQDTSLGEWRNFLPLLRNAMAQSEQVSILLVGDIKQSIYRWRGSDWSILGSTAPAELGKENVDIQTLGCNYRSLPRIVEFNNEVMGRAVEIDNEALNSRLDKAVAEKKIEQSRSAALHDTLRKAYDGLRQTPMRKSKHEGYIKVSVCKEEPDVVGCIKALIDRGYRPCDITVLVRSKRESYRLAEALLAVKADGDGRYRFDVMTQEALKINGSPSVRLILAIMRLAVNRNDTLSKAVCDRMLKGCDFTAPITESENSFLDSLRTLSPAEAFERVVMQCGLSRAKDAAYIQALHEHVVRFCASKVADIALFLRWWDENGDGKSVCVERSDSAIEIMTIHKAKGLENKVVLLPYCNWSLDPKADSGWRKNMFWAKPSKKSGLEGVGTFPVPVSKAASESAFAEGYYDEVVYSHVDSINLLYVALTRAAEELYIFIPQMSLARSNNAGTLVYNAIGADKFTFDTESDTTVCTFGKPDTPEPDSEKSEEEKRSETANASMQVRLTEYGSSPVKMNLRLSAARYFEEGEKVCMTPRNMGILLHRAFENAATRDDIFAALAQMVTDGVLSAEESTALAGQITSTLDNTVAGEWFSDKWTAVRREENIVIPREATKGVGDAADGSGLRRPDRVMLRGDEAVVVDYKFGKRKKEHTEQVCGYAGLLTAMNYSRVRGYVWYVHDGEIVECFNRSGSETGN